MKKLLVLSAFFIFACSSDDNSVDDPIPAYTIEGKWIYPENSLNTMYIFHEGVRYTYYCVGGDCMSQYEAFEAADGNHIPGTHNYTFEDAVLTVDLNFGNELITPVAFECDGAKAYFETAEYSLIRLGSSCD